MVTAPGILPSSECHFLHYELYVCAPDLGIMALQDTALNQIVDAYLIAAWLLMPAGLVFISSSLTVSVLVNTRVFVLEVTSITKVHGNKLHVKNNIMLNTFAVSGTCCTQVINSRKLHSDPV